MNHESCILTPEIHLSLGLERSVALNDGKEEGVPPFQIVKIKGLAASSTGR